jgi:hypothetical protein
MDNAENISVPTALSGEVDALGILHETFVSEPDINDGAENVSVDSLSGDQVKQQYHHTCIG